MGEKRRCGMAARISCGAAGVVHQEGQEDYGTLQTLLRLDRLATFPASQELTRKGDFIIAEKEPRRPKTLRGFFLRELGGQLMKAYMEHSAGKGVDRASIRGLNPFKPARNPGMPEQTPAGKPLVGF